MRRTLKARSNWGSMSPRVSEFVLRGSGKTAEGRRGDDVLDGHVVGGRRAVEGEGVEPEGVAGVGVGLEGSSRMAWLKPSLVDIVTPDSCRVRGLPAPEQLPRSDVHEE